MKRTRLIASLVAAAFTAALPLAAHAGDWSTQLAAQFKDAGLSPGAGKGFRQAIKVAKQPSATAVVGLVRGTDPALAKEYVVIQAEMDSAETVLEAARQMRAGPAPRRSILFAVIASGQEAAFAARPPVAHERIIASLGLANASDAAAALTIAGAEDTSLGVRAHALALSARLTTAPTTDAPRFLEAGVPALTLTFAEAQAAPAYLASLASQVADSVAHPSWARSSRFAPPMPQANALITAPVELPLGRHPQRNLGDYATWEGIRLR